MTPTDRVIDEIWREVGRLFRQFDLTPDEKRWIEENANVLNEFAIERLGSDRNAMKMRPLVIAYAIAQCYSGLTIDELRANAPDTP